MLALVALAMVTPSSMVVRKILAEREMNRWLRETHAFLLQDERSKANATALKAFQRSPNDPRSLRAMGYFASYIGAEEAQLFWDMLESGHGGCTSEDYQIRIFCAEQRGEPELAVGLADEALLRYPDEGELLIVASKLHASREIGNWTIAAQWADKAKEYLPPGDIRPELMRAVAILRGRLGGPVEVNTAVVDLARISKREDGLGLEALGELIEMGQSKDVSLIDLEGLLQLVREHPESSFTMILDVYDIMIAAVPQDARKVRNRAISNWEELDGPELLALCNWLNSHRDYEQTMKIISDELMRSVPELVGPRAESLLNLARFKKLEELLSMPRLSLPEAHRHYILARATKAAGWPVGGESLHDHLQAAETACRGAVRPDVAMAVGRIARESGYLSLARRVYEFAEEYPETAVDAERALLQLADETENPVEAAERARRIAELLPESIHAQAEALERKLEAGVELELVLARIEELAARHPDRDDLGEVRSQARRMHGMEVSEQRESITVAVESAAARPARNADSPGVVPEKTSTGSSSQLQVSRLVPVAGHPPGKLPGMSPDVIPGTGTMSGSVFLISPSAVVKVPGSEW